MTRMMNKHIYAYDNGIPKRKGVLELIPPLNINPEWHA